MMMDKRMREAASLRGNRWQSAFVAVAMGMVAMPAFSPVIAVAVFPILVPIYLLFSQKRIYGDGWPMTLLRFAIIALLYFALAVLAVAAAFAMALLLEG